MYLNYFFLGFLYNVFLWKLNSWFKIKYWDGDIMFYVWG